MVECFWCKEEFTPPPDAERWGFGVEYMVFCSEKCYAGHGYRVMLDAGELDTLKRKAELLERIRDAKRSILETDREDRRI